MNYAFTVALDRPATSRSMSAFVDDDFTVAVTFYDVDGEATVSDLTGDTASLEIVRCGDVQVTVTGTVSTGVATFSFADTDLSEYEGRNVWRVKLVRDGASLTVIDGILTVQP